jgi:hypothetical protein
VESRPYFIAANGTSSPALQVSIESGATALGEIYAEAHRQGPRYVVTVHAVPPMVSLTSAHLTGAHSIKLEIEILTNHCEAPDVRHEQ